MKNKLEVSKAEQMEAILKCDPLTMPSDFMHKRTDKGYWITVMTNRLISVVEFETIVSHKFTQSVFDTYEKQTIKTVAIGIYADMFDDEIIGCIVTPINFYPLEISHLNTLEN